MHSEMKIMEGKLQRNKDKKKAIEGKMEVQREIQQQMILMSSKDNNSFY